MIMRKDLTPIAEEKHELFESKEYGLVRRITSIGGVRWEQKQERDPQTDPLHGHVSGEWVVLRHGLGGDMPLGDADRLEEDYLRGSVPGSLFTHPRGYREHK